MPNPNNHKLRTAVTAGSLLVAFLLTAMITQSDAYEILYEGLPTGPGVILEDRDDQVYVAVYGDHGIVIRNSGDAGSWEVWQRGAIHGLQIMPDGDVWISQDGQIVRYPRRAARAPPAAARPSTDRSAQPPAVSGAGGSCGGAGASRVSRVGCLPCCPDGEP